MTAKSTGFLVLSRKHRDRLVEVHCNTEIHVTLTYPANRYSGEQTGIDVEPCNCPKPADEQKAAA